MNNSLLNSFATVEIPPHELVAQEDKLFIEKCIKEADELRANLLAWEKHIKEGISLIGDSLYKKLTEETRRDGGKYWHIESNLAIRGNKRMHFSAAYSLEYIYETLDWINRDSMKEVHGYMVKKYQLEEEIDEDELERITDPWEVVRLLSGKVNNIPFREVAVKNICQDMNLTIHGQRNQEVTINKNILAINQGLRYQESFRKGIFYFQTRSLDESYEGFKDSLFTKGVIIFPDDCKIDKIKNYQNSRIDIAFRSIALLNEFIELFRLKITY